ncbi:MAG TPA: GGDEF domain-containing protein [Burkholderiales bacterium]
MKSLRTMWSSTDFGANELTRYASAVMCREARQGIFVLGILTMLLMAGLALLYHALGLGAAYPYTFGVLALLALHVAVSARAVTDIKVLYLLGMMLLAVSGLAFVLLAHRYGVFTATLFSTVVLLFMVIPLVPWGLREALFAVGTIYLIFTGSTLSVAGRFAHEALWTLQFLMLSAAVISLALVAFAIVVRKEHLEARFKLTAANEKLAKVSLQDPLTGAWNRRFLDEHFGEIVARHAARGEACALGVLDVDRFKELNDSYGHACGDRVLQRLVKALTQALDADEYVVRIGGDEFVLIMREEAAKPRLERALEWFREREQDFPDLPAMPSVSIGMARVPPEAPIPLREAYLLADKSLYAAKAGGRGRVVESTLGEEVV